MGECLVGQFGYAAVGESLERLRDVSPGPLSAGPVRLAEFHVPPSLRSPGLSQFPLQLLVLQWLLTALVENHLRLILV